MIPQTERKKSSPISFEEAVAEERTALGLPVDAAPTALCLSGGGIRSATFALGVIQGLARAGLLDKFHYLSTVSGGGYIGSWLTAWIHRQGMPHVVAELSKASRTAKPRTDKTPIQWLRDYSNYLSPRLGLFSADTWTLGAIFLRNLALNWLVLLPMIAGALFIPRVCVAALPEGPPTAEQLVWIGIPSLVLGGLFALLAISQIAGALPSRKASKPTITNESGLVKYYLVPMVVAAIFLTTSWFYLAQSSEAARFAKLWQFSVYGIMLHAAGWWIGFRRARVKSAPMAWVAIAAAGAAGGLLIGLVATRWLTPQVGRMAYVTLASPTLVGLLLAAGIVMVGIASFREDWMDDSDREWWARSGAWLLIGAFGWLSFSGLTLYGPLALFGIGDEITRRVAAAGGTAAGVISAVLGWTSKTTQNSGKDQGPLLRMAVQSGEKLLAPLFALTLVTLISMADSALLLRRWVDSSADHLLSLSPAYWVAPLGWLAGQLRSAVPDWMGDLAAGAGLLVMAAVIAVIGYVLGWLLSVNRFSLHNLYRNRLIRAYLGASNDARQPNPITGFDPRDNLLMQELAGHRPMHVLNLALNITSGGRLAWQQRQAASFTVTPVHSGSWIVGYQPSKDFTDAGGVSLGTAVAISGAAASPNMGYHSSKVLTFLMAIFNLRLGGWFPNPVNDDLAVLRRGGPDSPLVLLREMLGMTDESAKWVYLSDGGHFENLGLYEMVRRRAKWIVASDASADPDYGLWDLGNTIRKIRIDMGVPIEFLTEALFRAREEGRVTHFALLEVQYSKVYPNESDGRILYIKPTISEAVSEDVRSYWKTHATFPHETTGDQFFDESQFEAYRRLGEQTVEIALKSKSPEMAEFFTRLRGQVPAKAATQP